MNQREYESALKDLLEEVCYRLDYYEPYALEGLNMPPERSRGSRYQSCAVA